MPRTMTLPRMAQRSVRPILQQGVRYGPAINLVRSAVTMARLMERLYVDRRPFEQNKTNKMIPMSLSRPSLPLQESAMFTRAFGIGIVAAVLAALTLQAVGAGDKKKFEIPKDAIAGTVKSVDEKGAKFTITLKSDKDKTFTVDAKTEFWGPKGGDRGTGPKGLMDEYMAKGYEIMVVPAKDPTVAKDVYLPNRKKAEVKKDDKK
jgi:hypothetical protein